MDIRPGSWTKCFSADRALPPIAGLPGKYHFITSRCCSDYSSPDWHLPRLLVEVLSGRPGRRANQRPLGPVTLYNFQILFGPELPGWHSPGLLDEVLLSGPGRCANRRLPGRVSLYNFQVLFKLELSGLTFAEAPGRSASEAARPKCKPRASRTDSNLQ